MLESKRKDIEFEILVSTMMQNSLTFLAKMFSGVDYFKYNILIINQTNRSTILESETDNIRVINSFERGLSRSRNLALRYAYGKVCLFADDDVIYKKDFKAIILEAFATVVNADIITFQMQDLTGKLFKNYPDIDWHNKKSTVTVNSVVIAFKREKIENSCLTFNTNFGLGAKFPTADEYIFLRDALSANLKVYFYKKVILSHKYFSSGRVLGSDQIIYARSAVIYKFSGHLAYLKLLKYLFVVLIEKEIKWSEMVSKYKVGIKGIRDYKDLIKLGSEKA